MFSIGPPTVGLTTGKRIEALGSFPKPVDSLTAQAHPSHHGGWGRQVGMSAELDWLRERAVAARLIASGLRDDLAVQGLLKLAADLEAKAHAHEAATTPVLPQAAAIPSGEPPIAQAGVALKSEGPPENSKGPHQ